MFWKMVAILINYTLENFMNPKDFQFFLEEVQ